METAIVFLYIISCKVVRLGHISLNKHTIVCSGSIFKNNNNTQNEKRYKKLKFDLRKKKLMRKLMEMLFSQIEGFGLNRKGFIG